MSDLNIGSVSLTSFKVGLGIGLIPVTATSLIACSKIIFINVIANVVVTIFSAGTMSISIPAAFVAVPLLWKISLIAACVGTAICVVALTAFTINYFYQKHAKKTAQPFTPLSPQSPVSP